ncbi:hypothetical protein BJX63DRAFT_419222 [Aspergillus granulosus]|uniref:PD-(D/E)XK nuclease-like domain-containing protein n=1 Tax=Aspergillus granulosus TaxID=176169 RepID=A0ABR4HVD8_9EURO
MIDICLYLSADKDDNLGKRIAKFRGVSPTLTVNHTDFTPICARPLLLSITTKKPGVNLDVAQLQMGSWHAAQWAFLRWAVMRKLKAKGLSILSTLGFIPGIIIQGHRWLLVLSTYDNGKTMLWTDYQFGTTQTHLGIYAVVAGVRRLTSWARDVYINWFQENVLD